MRVETDRLDTNSKTDVFTVSVIRARLENITRHMADTLVRTSYSPVFYDMNDFSTALFDGFARLIAQSIGCPVHLASLNASVKNAVRYFEGDIAEGDVLFLNDPYRGGTHIPDLTFISTIFHRGELVGFSATRAHTLDFGGAEPGSRYGEATEIFQEGLRVPPVKLYKGGKPDGGLLNLILANVRIPHLLRGDIRAFKASNDVGDRLYVESYGKYGKERMEDAISEIIRSGEKSMKERIKEIPSGTYTAEDCLETDGITEEPVKLRVKVEVDNSEIKVDWTGTSPPVEGPVNRPKHAAIGDTQYAIKALIDPKGPINEGSFLPIKVFIPENCLLNAKLPRPVYQGNLQTTGRITDVLWAALAPAMKDEANAMMYGGCIGVSVGGIDPSTNRGFVMLDVPGGGWGGRKNKDGMNATFHLHGNCKILPAEICETVQPVVIRRSEYNEGSAGHGKWRGGLGLIREYETLVKARLGTGGSRSKKGPPGIFGGLPGAPLRYTIILPTGEEKIIGGLDAEGKWRKPLQNFSIPACTIVRVETSGGGGYGDPLEREQRLVFKDVRNGIISKRAATKIYGVTLEENDFRNE